MSIKSVYTICAAGFPGANYALEMLSRTTDLTRHIRIASTQAASAEIRFVSELVRADRPRLVLFGGWSEVYGSLVADIQNDATQFGVYWTSSGGQTDMANEMGKFARILNAPAIRHLLFTSRGIADALRAAGRDALYLPLTLVPPAAGESNPVPVDTPLRISLFCPPAEYRRKNILNALLALEGVEGNWMLVLNGLDQHPDYSVVLDMLGLQYEDLGWMERTEYEKALASIGLGLQLSFADSFNYVAAEHLLRGIPVLASPMVPVMDCLDEETRAALVVPSPDNIDAIRSQIQTLVDAPALRRELGERARAALLEANAENIAHAKAVLGALM